MNPALDLCIEAPADDRFFDFAQIPVMN